jgi:hypothetical protein
MEGVIVTNVPYHLKSKWLWTDVFRLGTRSTHQRGRWGAAQGQAPPDEVFHA